MTVEYDFPIEYLDDAELRDFYRKNGYVSIKGGIPKKFIDLIVSELNEIFLTYATDCDNPFDSAVLELDRNHKDKLYELHTMAVKLTSFSNINSLVSGYINDICGKKMPQFTIGTGFLLGIPKDSRLVYDFHQESNYMKGFDDIFNVHYPLLRTSNFENGTMSVLPGSHKLGTLDYSISRVSENSYTNLVPSGIEEITNSYKELYNFLEVGDVLIFHKDLIHKSNYNSSELTRPVGIGRLTTSLNAYWKRQSPKDL